jgi:hypothetical protein
MAAFETAVPSCTGRLSAGAPRACSAFSICACHGVHHVGNCRCFTSAVHSRHGVAHVEALRSRSSVRSFRNVTSWTGHP